EPAAPAEPGAPPAENTASRPTPPRLLENVEPAYPESQRASGQSAHVGLTLKLDDAGNVSDVSVTESGGPDFDAAALEAARRLRFEPARIGDRPIPSKIPFRFDFQLAAPAPVVAAPVIAAPPPPPIAPAGGEATLDVEVEGDRPPREPTKRVLSQEEITKIPGTNGDALKSLQNLPGVARPPGLDGALIVRGSSPRDSEFFVDGSNVPLVYHFGGLSSVVPSEVLDHIDFYPGNFGPEYGRISGGVVDVGVKSPQKDHIGGLLQFDLIDGRVLVQGPIGDKTRFLLGGRRSWVDAWLGPTLRSAGVQVSTAPVYYDAQAMIEHDVTRDTTLRLFVFGSDDKLKLLFASPDASDPATGGDLLLHTGFSRVQLSADTRLTPELRWRNMVSLGHDVEQIGVGNLATNTRINALNLRSDLRAQLSDIVTLNGGLDVQTGTYDVAWRVPPFDIDTGDFGGPAYGRPVTELKADGSWLRPGAYAQAELTPLPGLKLLPGVRTDYIRDASQWTFDPRLGLRWDLYPSSLRTTLKGGVGVFHKPPEAYETIRPFGNPDVRSERALHYSLGIEQELSRPIEVSVEGFYKDLSNLVVSTPSTSTESGVDYANLGKGRTYGAEFLLRFKPEGRFFGWVAYTLSRSERKDSADEAWRRFEYDQTHMLTALGSYKLGRGWQLGARFRYVTGSPYTPNIGGVMDYDAGVYSPLEQQPEYGSRLPAFSQLDLRVDKTWDFESWKLSAYLDVQNAYNRKNTEDISYNYDYSQHKQAQGLPILPVLGIRGEL
ncbi:MAG TPA: TonB-dependent receptor, partial [Polyangiaceae bacterium]|nr:TonB-dependent receptor [Polyangiaceae bacterium]